ncbi:hypothetical protein ACOSQ2_022951 [Xanthoceras sorbifolium]
MDDLYQLQDPNSFCSSFSFQMTASSSPTKPAGNYEPIQSLDEPIKPSSPLPTKRYRLSPASLRTSLLLDLDPRTSYFDLH